MRKAADLDPAALREVAESSGAVADPAVRGGLAELETNEAFAGINKPEETGLARPEHLRQLASAVRHAASSDAPPPGHAVAAPPAKPGPDLADSAPARLGGTETLEGKPVHFLAVDPLTVVTDASTFQFKSEGDAAGVTARLRSVKRWDPLSAGKAFIFERLNGELVIADGHQRRGLAARLADQQPKPMLHAYVFREADGWTPADVRAHAALKNMRELSGTAVDMAKVMRERPDLIDDSLPLSDGKMREAVMLARLSDEAFGAVVAGRLPPTFAALIGEHVTDPARHAGLLNEIAAADLANAAQARFYLAQLLELPTTTESQITLFGEELVTRTLMAERSRVLDASLRGLKSDKRIFGLLEREARRISEGGNVLDREGNAARAQDAGQLGELIEKLATTRGTVATLLNDAAIAVSRGLKPAEASRAFVRRIGDILDTDGINGLLKAEPAAAAETAPLRIDEPNGPEAKAQAEALEQSADQGVMFALPGFFSPAIRAAETLPQEKGTGEQFLAQIVKAAGVKKDELDWMGLEEFLKGKKSVTRAEVLDFMRANQVVLDEKVLGGKPSDKALVAGSITPEQFRKRTGASEGAFPDAEIQFIEEFSTSGKTFYVVKRSNSPEYSVVSNALEDLGRSTNRAEAEHIGQGWAKSKDESPRFSGYKVPGGENYRELLIRLPELGETKSRELTPEENADIAGLRVRLTEARAKLAGTVETNGSDSSATFDIRDEINFINRQIREIEDQAITQRPYLSKHFNDQEIAHLRVDDRVGPGGEKVLFINEVQSDLHQAGRTKGYISRGGEEGIEALYSKMRSAAPDIDPAFVAERLRFLKRFGGPLDELPDPQMQHAASALTEAELGRLYRLQNSTAEEVITDMQPVPDAPFKGDLWLELALKRALQYATENGYDAVSWARSDQIAKAVGAQPEKLALQYDSKIGKFLDKYTKKWGGKVEDGLDIDTEQVPARRGHANAMLTALGDIAQNPERMRADAEKVGTNKLLRITPEMRASAAEAQPLFAAGRRQDVPAPWGGRATITGRYAGEAAAMRAEIDKAISKVLPPSWRHEVRDELIYGHAEGAADAHERIVYVSMAALDPLARAYEEAGHALKASGLIPAAQYDILRAEAQRLKARAHFGIDRRYGALYGQRWQGAALEGRLEEEAIMQMIAAHATGRTAPDFQPASAARRVMDRITKFFRAVQRALGLRGFNSYEDVFDAIVSGQARAGRLLPEAEAADGLARMREVMFATGEGGDNGAQPAGAGAAASGSQPAAETRPAAQPGAEGRQGNAGGRPRGNVRDLINGALAEGRLTREDADVMLTRYDELERHYAANPPQAAEQLAEEIDAEAAHRQRQRLLGKQKRRQNESFILDFRDERGQPDPARAMVAIQDHHGVVAMPKGMSSAVGRERAILGTSMARMTDLLGEFSRSRLTGRTRNRARLDNVVRELFGQDTGDEAAKAFARTWSEVAEDLRQRYNAAGGAIGRLEQWGLPQAHDRVALLRRGMERWIADITPLLDATRMRNPLTGNAMTSGELRRSLEWIYKEITSDGWHEREASMVRRGLGSVANQRGSHRFLVFKNADAWLRYQADYGAGGNPFVTMMSHLRGMARDIADMEVLGPNPRAMLTYMQQVVEREAGRRAAGLPALFPEVTRVTGRRMAGEGNWAAVKNAEDYGRSMIELAENMYNIRRGHAGAVVNSRVAAVFDVMRNLNVANQLGGAFLSAATDVGFQRSARAFAGLSQTRLLGDIVRENFSRESRFDAVRAGLILDSALDTLKDDARFFGGMNGPAWSRVIADRTLNWSLLQTWTQAGKHAWGKAVMLEFADNVASPFAELPARLRSMLERYGLDSGDWDGMRLGADGTPREGLDYLTPMGVWEARRAAGLTDTLHERYLEMILQEGEYAVPTGTLEAQARSYGRLRRGVVVDELRRSAMQYKMFGLTVALLQSQRIVAETLMRGVVTGAQIAAGLVIGTTLLGALSIQLKELSRGKDLRPMTEAKFWLAAFLQGGGAGIFGDFLFAEQNRFGGGLAETVAGPTVGNVAQALRLTAGNLQRGVKGEKANVGREAVQFLGRNTPFSSLWYLRLGYERVLLDQLQELADPDAKAAWRRRVQMQKRDYGNDFYWMPGEPAPRRAPALMGRR